MVAQDLGSEQVVRGDGGDVAVEDDEVGEEAGFEAAFAVFAELSEGRCLGVGVDGFRKRRCVVRGGRSWVPSMFWRVTAA